MNKLALEAWVDAYIQVQETAVVDGNHPLWWAIDNFIDAVQSDPEQAWEAICRVVERRPSEQVLGNLGAGPLEDLIHQHGEAFIDRIEAAAISDQNFRKVLAHVWQSGSDEIWRRVEIARQGF